MNELMRMVSGEVSTPRGDRELVGAAKGIRRRVQLADWEVEAEFALTGKIMQGACDLDDYAKHLAGGDPVKRAIVGRFQATAYQKVEHIQRNWNSGFGL